MRAPSDWKRDPIWEFIAAVLGFVALVQIFGWLGFLAVVALGVGIIYLTGNLGRVVNSPEVKYIVDFLKPAYERVCRFVSVVIMVVQGITYSFCSQLRDFIYEVVTELIFPISLFLNALLLFPEARHYLEGKRLSGYILAIICPLYIFIGVSLVKKRMKPIAEWFVTINIAIAILSTYPLLDWSLPKPRTDSAYNETVPGPSPEMAAKLEVASLSPKGDEYGKAGSLSGIKVFWRWLKARSLPDTSDRRIAICTFGIISLMVGWIISNIIIGRFDERATKWEVLYRNLRENSGLQEFIKAGDHQFLLEIQKEWLPLRKYVGKLCCALEYSPENVLKVFIPVKLDDMILSLGCKNQVDLEIVTRVKGRGNLDKNKRIEYMTNTILEQAQGYYDMPYLQIEYILVDAEIYDRCEQVINTPTTT